MRGRELRTLLDEVPDTRELILRGPEAPGPAWGAVHAAWNDAHADAERLMRTWLRTGGSAAYAAYRAAQDREDAAQDALFRAVADERIAAAVGAATAGVAVA